MAPRELILNTQLRKALALPINQRWTESRRFLLAGANPNLLVQHSGRPDSPWPILHKAIQENSYEAVELLLERGADTRLQNPEYGFDGTELAAYLGREQILELILAGQPPSQELKNTQGCG